MDMNRPSIFPLLLALSLTACAHPAPDDPLVNTKTLVREGHLSLYENGAFHVPHTSIALIPPGPDALELAQEMMGMKARESFLTALKQAQESVYIIPEGTALSLEYAGKIQTLGTAGGEAVTDVTRPLGMLLIDRSSDLIGDSAVDSWRFGKELAEEMGQFGIVLSRDAVERGAMLADAGMDLGRTIVASSGELAQRLSAGSIEASGESLDFAWSSFVDGYLALPENLAQRGSDVADSIDLTQFEQGFTQANELRAEYSETFTDLFGQALEQYGDDVASDFAQAGKEFDENLDATGLGLASIKAMRWVLQGVFWDGLIKPLAQMGTSSVGYLAVNTVAFPVLVVWNEGMATTTMAVEVTWHTGGMAYDIVAPTATAALAGVYSLLQVTGGQAAATTVGVTGAVAGSAAIATGQATGRLTQGVGYLTGQTIRYVGVPLTAVGATVGKGSVGVVGGAVGAAAGATVMVAGEGASLASKGFGTVLAGSTAVVGTAASTLAGAGLGIYSLSKAVVVPPTYELGGGVVLGYGTISHLAAHSVLAVSDAAYLVLSLEGPRWVIYAVQGNLGKGADLPPGAVLDLKKMQQAGEEIRYLPVSQEEMNAVVQGEVGDLPVLPQEATAP